MNSTFFLKGLLGLGIIFDTYPQTDRVCLDDPLAAFVCGVNESWSLYRIVSSTLCRLELYAPTSAMKDKIVLNPGPYKLLGIPGFCYPMQVRQGLDSPGFQTPTHVVLNVLQFLLDRPGQGTKD